MRICGINLVMKYPLTFCGYFKLTTGRIIMKYEAGSVEEYFGQLPAERKPAMQKLLQTIRDNIPQGFDEVIGFGMPAFVVPHSLYPNGYHVNPELPLPFLNIASQKNFIVLYHMGIYAEPELMKWFIREYPNHCTTKLNMGKSCIRFKKPEDIPFELIGELVKKMSPGKWIATYEKHIKR